MFHQNYLRAKALKLKLLIRLETDQAIQNAPIYFRDILAYEQSRSGLGESYCDSIDHAFTPIRLVDHIQSLANIANCYHQKYYCTENQDGIFTLKSDCLNKVTRLLLPEFALYTATPLSLDQFNMLCNETLSIARQKLENVHLLLSSIAVHTEDQQILNVSLYVQCGKEAKLNVICKARADIGDVKFNGYTNFSQQNLPIHTKELLFQKCTPFIGKLNSHPVSNISIFTAKTAGGACYIQAIDICKDHLFAHSKNLLKKSLATNTNEIFAKQVDHILSSNTVHIVPLSRLCEKVIQIDPKKSQHNLHKDKFITEAEVNKALVSMSPPQLAKTFVNGYLITDPVFGSNYRLIATAERKIQPFLPVLASMIKTHNKLAKQLKIKQALRGSSNYMQIEKMKDMTKCQLASLKKTLSMDGQPLFTERLFKPQLVTLKKELLNRLQTLLEKKRTLNAFTLHKEFDVFLADFKMHLKQYKQLDNSFVKSLLDKIHVFQSERAHIFANAIKNNLNELGKKEVNLELSKKLNLKQSVS